jgi:hypothetical protein
MLQPMKASNEPLKGDLDSLCGVVRGSRAVFRCYHRAQPAGVQLASSFQASILPNLGTMRVSRVHVFDYCDRGTGPARTMIRLSNVECP